jgi:hypothetical protein
MINAKNESENFKLFRTPAFNDLEFAKVSNQTHVYPRHWNETCVIQVVEQGINEGHCRGATYRVSTGSILFINPHEIHTGSAVGPEPLIYRSLYPTPELLGELASQCSERQMPLPFFPALIVADARLAKMFVDTHRACEAGASKSSWKFSGKDGKSWNGTASVKAIAGEKNQLAVTVKIARGESSTR